MFFQQVQWQEQQVCLTVDETIGNTTYVPGLYVYGQWVQTQIEIGSSFPLALTNGQQFYLTDNQTIGNTTYVPGLYVYNNSWQFICIQLLCYANVSDGSRTLVSLTSPSSPGLLTGTVYWSLDSVSQSFASIDIYGNLTLIGSVPSSELITVTATYSLHTPVYDINNNPIYSFTAIYYVAVVVPIVTLQSIKLTAPTTMMELSQDQIICDATFEDGSIIQVQPNWTILSTQTQFDASDLAQIDRNGNLSIKSIEIPTVIILRAQYFGAITQVYINLEMFSYALSSAPYSAYIDGPTSINQTTNFAQYTFYLVQKQGDTRVSLTPVWTLTDASTGAAADPNIVNVDTDGTVFLFEYVALNIVLTATYSCGYENPVIATFNLQTIGPINAGNVAIQGPASIYDETTTQYLAYVTDSSGVVTDVHA